MTTLKKLLPVIAVGVTGLSLVTGCGSSSSSSATSSSSAAAPTSAAAPAPTSGAAAPTSGAAAPTSGAAAPTSGAAAPTSAAATGASASAAAPSTGGKVGKIVYIPGLTGNPFYSTVSCGAGTEAKKLGVDFATQGSPMFDVTLQTQIVNAVTASKPGAIMISITDPKAMISPLAAAKKAGIKIIGIDGDLTDTSIMTTNIQSDGVAGGKLAGEALGKAVGGKGTVLILDNATGSIVSKARTDGFTAGIKEFPAMKILPIQYTANDVSKAASITSTTATTNSDLVGVFGAETNNTQGAITGLREAGKTSKVKVTGYDTSDPIVTALKANQLLGTVVQNPRGEGVTGVESAVAAMQGKSVPRNQAADALFVTPANLNSAKAQSYIYDVNCKIQ